MEKTDVKQSAELREKATNWLNSKTRDIDDGLAILKEANYKPHVIAIFEKNKNRRDIPGKVVQEIFNYLRYFANPTKDIHKDELSAEDLELVEKEKEFTSNIEKELANEEYPGIVKAVLTEFNEDYKIRSISHTELKSIGEGNDEDSCAKRKAVLSVIANCSDRMDILWPAFELFKADGTLPSEELFAVAFNPNAERPEDKEPEGEKEKELILAADVEGLKKQSENWRGKLVKAKNKLEFGKETKSDKPNPMPEGPKRILQVKRIERLTAEKLAIDTALANMQ